LQHSTFKATVRTGLHKDSMILSSENRLLTSNVLAKDSLYMVSKRNSTEGVTKGRHYFS
jgi:hypothetical protein